MGPSDSHRGLACLSRASSWRRPAGRRHRDGSPVLRLFSCADMSSPLPRWIRESPAVPPYSGPGVGAQGSRRRPSPLHRGVGIHERCFGACSAFTRVTTCLLAESPSDPLTSEASADSLPPRLFRLLPGGTANFPGGSASRWKTAPFHGARCMSGLARPFEHLRPEGRTTVARAFRPWWPAFLPSSRPEGGRPRALRANGRPILLPLAGGKTGHAPPVLP